MATTTDLVSNEYLVFEADQVLTNDHLNQMFYYLDQQNRWTRNKLIGIGIVCGLDIVQHTGVIEITSGCGVTSQGYLINLSAKQYTYYLPYTGIDQPKDLPFTYPGDLPFYKPFDAGKTIFSLLTDDDFTALETDAKSNAQTISSINANNGLIDYAVVLFVEAGEQDLKNCDMFDCNNKGEKMMMNLRTLLVKKNDLPGLQKSIPVIPVISKLPVPATAFTVIKPASLQTLQPDREGMTQGQVLANRAAAITSASVTSQPVSTGISGNILSGIATNILFPVNIFSIRPPEINLKRFNVPYTDLQTTDDVINAFIALVDDGTLSAVASAYNYSYNHYKDVLDDSATGFPTLLTDLKAQRDLILKNNPVFIQYFYGFIDDLTKAYYEFRSKVSLLLSGCCPDENKFPLHLVLGAATANTKDFTKDAYRTYFIYSPLFARQENEISETQFLFRRMQVLTSEFTMITPDDVSSSAVKILPSLYRQAALSQRAIPYYYTVNDEGNELYKYWNYSKTIRGDEASNLSYNADQYSSNIAVLNPLLYDIEKYDFFRIEGHIGTNYQAALTNIIQQRKTYNLPFDVVAVSADQLTNNTTSLPQCNVQDLDTDFKLLISEFTCKIHIPFCFITKLTNPPVTSTAGNTGIAGGVFTAGNFSNINMAAGVVNSASSPQVSFTTFKLQNALTDKILINPGIFQLGYRKGDFMRKYCTPAAGVVTIGSVYLASITNGVFTNPVPLSSQSVGNISYYRLLDYVDAVESLMQVLMPATLTTLDTDAFTTAYKRFADSLFQVTFALTEIMNDKSGTTDNTLLQFLKDIQMDILVDELAMPVYDCLDKRLQTLQSEYANRLQQYQNSLNFLYYYNKHYGLEHKDGVPKGGTFVLVYRPAAPATTTTGTVAGTATNTGVVAPAFPQTGSVLNTGTLSTGIINTGTLKTGILRTSAGNNPVITGGRLFMAKAPKKTPDKSNKKEKKTTVKEEGLKPKDTVRRDTTLTATTGTINIPVTPVVKPEQPVITGTRPVAEQPVIIPVKPVAEQPGTVPIKTVTEQPVINVPIAEQPVITATQPVLNQPVNTSTQPVIIATQPVAEQPVKIGTRPPIIITQPAPVETRPPVATQPVITVTKPFEPVIIATQPGRVVTQLPTAPILQQPTRIPISTNFPPIAVGQPQIPVNTGSSVINTIDLINNFANTSADLSSDNKKTILDFLKGAKQQLAASKFSIADNVVIADFYVPYLCCSDCPPVAYIVQQPAPTPPPSEAPSFDITPKEFLFDDTAIYPFTLKPPVTDANKAADPFTSDTIINPGSLHLSTDDNNTLFLHPAMPDLTVTTTATIAYQNIPVDITIIKPDATFAINLVTNADGTPALQVVPADANADGYKWTVNGVENVFDNSQAPAAVSINDIRNKVQTSPFTIALTLSYTRNTKTSADTKQQVYQPSVCIDFDSFELNTEFGSRVGQKEGDVAFSTNEKIVASVLAMKFPADSAFGVATIITAPANLGDGQCLQMNTIAMKFDYSQSTLKPTQVTVEFLNLQGIVNLAVNDSDMFTDDISKLPKQLKDVQVSTDKAGDGSAMLVLKGNIASFIIGGQQFFIDNVCAQ